MTVHGKNGWEFTNKGGGWEYPAFWAAALLVLFLLGDGAGAEAVTRPLNCDRNAAVTRTNVCNDIARPIRRVEPALAGPSGLCERMES